MKIDSKTKTKNINIEISAEARLPKREDSEGVFSLITEQIDTLIREVRELTDNRYTLSFTGYVALHRDAIVAAATPENYEPCPLPGGHKEPGKVKVRLRENNMWELPAGRARICDSCHDYYQKKVIPDNRRKGREDDYTVET